MSILGPAAAAPGQRVALRCRLDSVPAANVSWTFNNSVTQVHDAVYVIERVEEEDLGNYTCTATNVVTMKENSTVFNLRGEEEMKQDVHRFYERLKIIITSFKKSF